MAAGYLPEPGKVDEREGWQLGPCVEPCDHTDCASTRAMADQACPHCGDPIGYEVAYFDVSADDQRSHSMLAHARCVYQHEFASR